MSVSDLLTIMGGSGGGVGIIFLVLFITGYIVPKSVVEEKNEEIAELKQELRIQQARGDAGVLAAAVTKELVSGLRKEQEPWHG